ncbi:paired small multidrug resistance pump [Scopulibacillus daqui]|uniref:Paired small multidrug resistance pump n=1 Tax=Scopulibacillus daqui TaxID=1469162 RepID=A0ABS2Q1V9_9BACL|nr:multidrug efflux SMR transporter [Scopulibacillus daqui]MBM7646272.1 paired small multidrug resistance pump [Scopulibacillus daqui]
MSWLLIILAGLLEIVWATGLKYADSLLTWTGVVIIIIISFVMMIRAFKEIPVTIGYTVFVGIGAIGTFIVGVFLGEPVSFGQIIFLALLLIGVIGMKATSDKNESETEGGKQ